MDRVNAKTAASLTLKKKIAFSVIITGFSFMILELCFRIYFAFHIGHGALF
jgi:hypothetical protein